MQDHLPGEAITESTADRPGLVAPARDAEYSRSRRTKGEVPEDGPATAKRQAAGGNGREPTIRELQSAIQANRRRIIRLEKQTRKGFKRQHRETRELRDLQNQMLGQMRAMMWIMGVIGGVTVLSLLGGVLVPAVARLVTPLAGG